MLSHAEAMSTCTTTCRDCNCEGDAYDVPLSEKKTEVLLRLFSNSSFSLEEISQRTYSGVISPSDAPRITEDCSLTAAGRADQRYENYRRVVRNLYEQWKARRNV